MIDIVLFCINYDGVFLKFLEKPEADKILFEMHAGPVGRNISGETTAHKVLREGYYWPTLFKDTYTFIIKCEAYQICSSKMKKPASPL